MGLRSWGGMGLAGYLLESLLETNAGILVLFCMLYLFLNGLAGVVSYQVWYQRAKRDLQRKKPVRYRSYPFFMVKDIAGKAFCLLLGVLFVEQKKKGISVEIPSACHGSYNYYGNRFT